MSGSDSDDTAKLSSTNVQSSSRRRMLALLGGIGGLGMASSQPVVAHRNSKNTNSNNTGRGKPNVDPDTEFSIAIFPDTQYYAEQDNGIFEQMAQWVADNKEKYNIQTFLHEGDIVQNNGSNNKKEWNIAQNAIGEIEDADIPAIVSLGNHDADNIRNPQTFRSRFPKSRYAKMKQSNETILDWGTFEGEPENAYLLQEIQGQRFLFMTLEFGARSAALEWGRQVDSDHPEAMTILTTHVYLDVPEGKSSPQWAGDGAVSGYVQLPENAGPGFIPTGAEFNNGHQMWQGSLRYWENLVNVHSGHFAGGEVTGNFVGRRTDFTNTGNRVTQMRMDYQTIDNGGDGWFRLFTINTDTYDAEISTYSPYLDEWSEYDGESFEFNLQDGVERLA